MQLFHGQGDRLILIAYHIGMSSRLSVEDLAGLYDMGANPGFLVTL